MRSKRIVLIVLFLGRPWTTSVVFQSYWGFIVYNLYFNTPLQITIISNHESYSILFLFLWFFVHFENDCYSIIGNIVNFYTLSFFLSFYVGFNISMTNYEICLTTVLKGKRLDVKDTISLNICRIFLAGLIKRFSYDGEIS